MMEFDCEDFDEFIRYYPVRLGSYDEKVFEMIKLRKVAMEKFSLDIYAAVTL